MFERLVESGHRPLPRFSPSLTALAVHAGLAAAGLRLAGAGQTPAGPRILPIPMMYEVLWSPTGAHAGSGRPGPPPVLDSPSLPALEVPLPQAIDLVDTESPANIPPRGVPSLGTKRGPGGSGPRIAELVQTAVAITDRAPSPLRAAEPVYPASLLAAGVEGSATIEFVVDSAGVPQGIGALVIQADRPAFGVAAMAAVLASRFTPGRSGGRVVPVRVRQVVRFRIEKF